MPKSENSKQRRPPHWISQDPKRTSRWLEPTSSGTPTPTPSSKKGGGRISRNGTPSAATIPTTTSAARKPTAESAAPSQRPPLPSISNQCERRFHRLNGDITSPPASPVVSASHPP